MQWEESKYTYIFSIAKDKAYLTDFYRAETEKEMIDVMKKYAQRMLDLIADIEVDKNYSKLGKKNSEILAPLGIRSGECSDGDTDHHFLTQDCMLHECNAYCLGEVKHQERPVEKAAGSLASDLEQRVHKQMRTSPERNFMITPIF